MWAYKIIVMVLVTNRCRGDFVMELDYTKVTLIKPHGAYNVYNMDKNDLYTAYTGHNNVPS